MPLTDREPATTETGKQIPARPHDSGSAANETVDGLDATTEALRRAVDLSKTTISRPSPGLTINPTYPPSISRKQRDWRVQSKRPKILVRFDARKARLIVIRTKDEAANRGGLLLCRPGAARNPVCGGGPLFLRTSAAS
jgi:hypothetical protein